MEHRCFSFDNSRVSRDRSEEPRRASSADRWIDRRYCRRSRGVEVGQQANRGATDVAQHDDFDAADVKLPEVVDADAHVEQQPDPDAAEVEHEEDDEEDCRRVFLTPPLTIREPGESSCSAWERSRSAWLEREREAMRNLWKAYGYQDYTSENQHGELQEEQEKDDESQQYLQHQHQQQQQQQEELPFLSSPLVDRILLRNRETHAVVAQLSKYHCALVREAYRKELLRKHQVSDSPPPSYFLAYLDQSGPGWPEELPDARLIQATTVAANPRRLIYCYILRWRHLLDDEDHWSMKQVPIVPPDFAVLLPGPGTIVKFHPDIAADPISGEDLKSRSFERVLKGYARIRDELGTVPPRLEIRARAPNTGDSLEYDTSSDEGET